MRKGNWEFISCFHNTVILSPWSKIRSAPAGSSVNAQGLTIVYGMPLSLTKSSPYCKFVTFTLSVKKEAFGQNEKEKENKQKNEAYTNYSKSYFRSFC